MSLSSVDVESNRWEMNQWTRAVAEAASTEDDGGGTLNMEERSDSPSFSDLVVFFGMTIFLSVMLVTLAMLLRSMETNMTHIYNPPPLLMDSYSLTLERALKFFDAHISEQGNYTTEDPSNFTKGQGWFNRRLFKAGADPKYPLPVAFTITMLCWSVIEYSQKYEAIGEFHHIRNLIKWGANDLLFISNSTVAGIDKIHSQDNEPQSGSATQLMQNSANLGGPGCTEMAAALAASSIVFRDDIAYSKKLKKSATTLFSFYSQVPNCSRNCNSSGYFDEYIWGATWLYYATGNISYISIATNQSLANKFEAFYRIPDSRVLSWDNKLPAAMLLLTRLRMFFDPGYPYEEMLRKYHHYTRRTMCSYLHQYRAFNGTKGGMNHGQPEPLQYVANAAFMASLFADYLNAAYVPGWRCGPSFVPSETLRNFAISQINYILGTNPMNMSYLVGYGTKFPTQGHQTGAMVGGPEDKHTNYSDNKPTLAGNAGLVAALVSLTSIGGDGIDKNEILFSAIAALHPESSLSPPP